ncbi:hypothetical protein B5F78_09920 [Bacteroides sp. An279]|nr:hypothetical protein B5F78_09920 [Bacteroides sp. An279]
MIYLISIFNEALQLSAVVINAGSRKAFLFHSCTVRFLRADFVLKQIIIFLKWDNLFSGIG